MWHHVASCSIMQHHMAQHMVRLLCTCTRPQLLHLRGMLCLLCTAWGSWVGEVLQRYSEVLQRYSEVLQRYSTVVLPEQAAKGLYTFASPR
jgi:hypothetical protein